MTLTTFDQDPDEIPSSLPFEVSSRVRQQRFEERLQKLTAYEKHRQLCILHWDLIQQEEEIRLLKIIVEQSDRKLAAAINLGISQMSFHVNNPRPFIDLDPTHDE